MVDIVFLLGSIISILYYLQKKYTNFIILLFFILSGGFHLLSMPSIKIGDYALLTCFILLAIEFKHDKSFFNCKNDKVGLLILLLIFYYLFSAIFSVVRQRESLFYSLLIFRFDLFYLSYFLFRKIDFESINKAFSKLIGITIIGGVLYYLQFIGVTGILQADSNMINASSGFVRLRNVPYLTVPVLFYLLVNQKYIKYRNLLIIFFCGLIVFPMNRGGIISSLLVVGSYFMIKRKVSLKHIFLITFIFLLFQPILSYRFSNNGSTGEGILSELTTSVGIITENDIDGYTNSAIYSDGTFVFRILLVVERLNYLSRSLTNLCLGIGTVHESSSSIRSYSFSLGTITVGNDGSLEMHQIDTNDVAFITHLFRFGLIYLFIFLCFLIVSLKRLYRSPEPLCITAFLFLFAKVVQSLGSDGFSSFESMGFILLILPLSIAQSKIKT